MYHLAKLIVTTFMSRNISVSALHSKLGWHIYVDAPKCINNLHRVLSEKPLDSDTQEIPYILKGSDDGV
jgi:hypothetical protein